MVLFGIGRDAEARLLIAAADNALDLEMLKCVFFLESISKLYFFLISHVIWLLVSLLVTKSFRLIS